MSNLLSLQISCKNLVILSVVTNGRMITFTDSFWYLGTYVFQFRKLNLDVEQVS